MQKGIRAVQYLTIYRGVVIERIQSRSAGDENTFVGTQMPFKSPAKMLVPQRTGALIIGYGCSHKARNQCSRECTNYCHICRTQGYLTSWSCGIIMNVLVTRTFGRF